MVLKLPCDPTLLYYDFDVELDGATYHLTFRWNERAEAWIFSIADAQLNPLLSGRRIVANWPLLARFPNPALPPGELVAYDPSGQNADPGVKELGDRVLFLYIEAATWNLPRIPP